MKLLSAQDRMAAITADVLVLDGFCGFHTKVWRSAFASAAWCASINKMLCFQ
jgi:hypothetical protein